MSEICIFVGTTDGKRLARRLGACEIHTTAFVAAGFRDQALEEAGLGDSVTVLHDRMSREDLARKLKELAPKIVVDATHPYALDVSEDIREAAAKADIPYIRMKRKTTDAPDRKVFRFRDLAEVLPVLQRTAGNILVTTGVDTLEAYASAEGLKERLYIRIRPEEEAFRACREAGIPKERIIAMQGPFSMEMNRATIHAYGIRHLVTKQSGESSGFTEKIIAAQETETAVYMIGEEAEEGVPYAKVLDRLGEILSVDLRDTITVTVSLVGMGPGEEGCLTRDAEKAIREADVLFGAEQLVESYRATKKTYPYDRGDDVLPRLEQLLQEARQGDPHVRAAVLLNGDTGFYSGSTGLIFYLTNWRRRMLLSDTGKFKMQIRTFPGISSIQMMAARLQDHWEKAYVSQLRGDDPEEWQEVVRHLPREKRTYLAVSGVEDVERLRKWILKEDPEREKYSIYAGYQLTLPEERIFADEGERPGLGTEDAKRDPFPDILPKGRYTVMIRNSEPSFAEAEKEKQVLAGISNDEFLQEKGIPISREEIRTLAIGKLRITEPAVIMDIGSGSGSVAVELGRILKHSEIYAIEKEPDRAELIRKNIHHLSANRVTVVEGEAPEILKDLPKPTHAMIRGADGKLFLILQELFRKSPNMRVVIAAVTLETKTELAQLLSGIVPTEYTILEPEYLEINVSRNRKTGRHHALAAENPVSILSFRFGRRPGA